jgi:hypothetical protein
MENVLIQGKRATDRKIVQEVSVTDDGYLQVAVVEGGGGGEPATTTTQASVAGSATAVTILAANADRIDASVYNDSTATLYLLVGTGTVSATNFTVKLGPDDLFVVGINYKGIISGIWSSATGNARVTELEA